jgi:hypothetical protein
MHFKLLGVSECSVGCNTGIKILDGAISIIDDFDVISKCGLNDSDPLRMNVRWMDTIDLTLVEWSEIETNRF